MRSMLICAATLALASACAPTTPTFDATAESAALLKRDAEWADLAAAGKDTDAVVSYWTDDAVIIFPGQPTVEGKAAIRKYVASSFATPGFRIHWKSVNPHFSPDGKMAWMTGADELQVPGPDGKPMTIPLRGVSIWRKDADGVWRCTTDISNEVPAPAGAQPTA